MLVPIGDVRRYVLSCCRALTPVEAPLSGAAGLVLAASVRAHEPVPPFTNSSMDGYALRAADVAVVPARLRQVGALMAGADPSAYFVGQGQAVRIMTGAPLPPGADAVCMVEHTRAEDGWVWVDEAVPHGASVRPVGDDIAVGAEVLPAGTVMGAAEVGVLASLGVTPVTVYPRPRVGVISTGDELSQHAGPLEAGQIRDSNRPALLAQLQVDGFAPLDLGHARDDPTGLSGALLAAVSVCDAVLTSGGVSVGDRDLVKTVLAQLGGASARWSQVAVRPGKPFAFATIGEAAVPVFGLPGNPVSALVSYELFARPALRLMAGHRALSRPKLAAVADTPLARSPDGKTHLLRVALSIGADGALHARPAGAQGSHHMRAMAAADGLAVVPDGYGLLAGARVDVMVLGPDNLSGPEGEGLDW